MAAHRQGKFWEMTHKLYGDTQKQSPEDIEGYAKALGLDLERFKKDQTSSEVTTYIDMDQTAGKTLKVSGTPSMFLNGKKLEARDLDAFKKAVDAELAEVAKITAEGKAPGEALRRRVLASGPDGKAFYEAMVLRKKVEPPPVAPLTVYDMPVDHVKDPVLGPKNALVALAECSDFQ